MKQAHSLAGEEKVPGDPIALMIWAAVMLLAIGLIVFTDQIATYLGPSRVIWVVVLASGCTAYLNARYGIRILRAATFPPPGSRFPFGVQRARGLQALMVGCGFIVFACAFTAKAAVVAWFLCF